MNNLIKDLIEKIEYFDFHNKNLTKEQTYKINKIKETIKDLKDINVWYEVAKNEVETAIEDIYNDSLYSKYKEKLEKITEEDISRIAWKVEDYDVWEDVYDSAKNEVYEEIGVDYNE